VARVANGPLARRRDLAIGIGLALLFAVAIMGTAVPERIGQDERGVEADVQRAVSERNREFAPSQLDDAAMAGHHAEATMIIRSVPWLSLPST
jgi:hypothetical protein